MRIADIMAGVLALVLCSSLSLVPSSVLAADKTRRLNQGAAISRMMIRKIDDLSAEQNMFLEFIEEENWNKALFQWYTAFRRGTFKNSPSGKALYSFLQWKSGLEIEAIENVLAIQEPGKIHGTMKRFWQQALDEKISLLQLPIKRWNDRWVGFFSPEVEAHLKLAMIGELDSKENFQQLHQLRKTVPAASEIYGQISWQLSLADALQRQGKGAVKVLPELIERASSMALDEDLMRVNLARIYYQRGRLKQAISIYKTIPKGSPYWFTAQEELATSYLRRGEPQNVMAISFGLTPETMARYVGPEMLFTRSLAQLKTCDYSGIRDSLKSFKVNYRERAKHLFPVAQGNTASKTIEAIELMLRSEYKFSDLALLSDSLPRYFGQSPVVAEQVRLIRAYRKEAQLAGQLYTRSLSEGAGRVGFLAPLDKIRLKYEKRATVTRQLLVTNVQNWSSEELTEIRNTLDKMQIVEAEWLQHLMLAGRVKENSKMASAKPLEGSTVKKTSNFDLEFPFQGELWVDELGSYKLTLDKGCIDKKEVSL